jgi:hypothetical protein
MKIFLTISIFLIFFMISCEKKNTVINVNESNTVNIKIPENYIEDDDLETGDEIETRFVFIDGIQMTVPITHFKNPSKVVGGSIYDLEKDLGYSRSEREDKFEIITRSYSARLKNYPDSNSYTDFVFFTNDLEGLYAYVYTYDLDELNIHDKQDFLIKTVERFNEEFSQIADKETIEKLNKEKVVYYNWKYFTYNGIYIWNLSLSLKTDDTSNHTILKIDVTFTNPI